MVVVAVFTDGRKKGGRKGGREGDKDDFYLGKTVRGNCFHPVFLFPPEVVSGCDE